MRIAIDATVVREPLSGVHYAVRGQTLALIRQLSDADLLVLATDPVLLEAAGNSGCKCDGTSPQLRIPLRRVFWQQFVLPRLLKQHGVDLLFAPTYTMPLSLKIPTVLEVHDTIGLDYPALCSRRNALSCQVLLRPSMNRAKRIIVATDDGAQRVMNHSNHTETTIHKAPLPADDIFRTPPTPGPEELAKHQPYILFVGNIEPKKDIDTLVYAFSRMSGKHTLLLVGRDGWKCRSTVKRLADYHGPGRIQRLGYVSRNLLPGLYAHAAATVLPSVVEGFGLPVVESLAMGTPIVHSNHPALMEVANGYGHSFPIGDADKLANALQEAISSKLPDTAVDYARAHTWDRWAETVSEVIRKVAATAS